MMRIKYSYLRRQKSQRRKKKPMLLAILMLLIAGFTTTHHGKTKDLSAAKMRITQLYAQQVGALDSFLQKYPAYFYDSSYKVRKRKYEELCYYFKQASGVILYFEPQLYYRKLIEPFHFEKNEKKGFYSTIPDSWLFVGPAGNEPDSIMKKFKTRDTLSQQHLIQHAIGSYRKALVDGNIMGHLKSMNESVLFDVLRTEIFRISTIDVANSDFINEEAALPSLQGSVKSWLLLTSELANELPASQGTLKRKWTDLHTGTNLFLSSNNDYSLFNRMEFIKRFLIPLSKWLHDAQLVLEVPFQEKNAALKSNARHIYDKDVFNINYFAPDKESEYTPAKAKLGELLFFDPVLSDNNKRACASCHKPQLAFTDGMPKSISFQREQLPRNSPTVINAGLQKNLFWDMRAGSMEDQLDSVVNNVTEMHSSFDGVTAKLNASAAYRSLFYEAFPASKKEGIKRKDIKNAIAVYERTLTGLNSRFDQYMQGDDTKLTSEEVDGFNIFMGKAKCGTCHLAPLFAGSLPPFFDFTDHHSIGVPVKDTMEKYVVDPDVGLMKINGDTLMKFSFKTPTVRNAALTAPYMHNGVYRTLEQVVDFYDHAGGSKFAKDMKPDMKGLPFFTILPIPLQLTDKEKKDLVLFMKALTDNSAARKVPVSLPTFKAPYTSLNKRTVGGEY